MESRPYKERAGRDVAAKAERTTLPEAPCFNCGARGWCRHRKPEHQPS
jgi:hypothetical protein